MFVEVHQKILTNYNKNSRKVSGVWNTRVMSNETLFISRSTYTVEDFSLLGRKII